MASVGKVEPASGNSGVTTVVGVGDKVSREVLVGVAVAVFVGVGVIPVQLQSDFVSHEGLTHREFVPSAKWQILPLPHSLSWLQSPQQALLQTQSLSSGQEGVTHFLLPATSWHSKPDSQSATVSHA